MHRLTKFFRNLNIRAKLFVGYSAVLILSLLILSSLIYSLMRTTVEDGIERELKNSTAAILDTVRTTASVSIKNYLRAVAEKNLEMIESIYARQQAGELSESAAQAEAARVFSSQTIGKTGYIYCINSFGLAVYHPNPSVNGHNFRTVDFIVKQIRRKTGYLEYAWRNPGESKQRKKALYMSYFAPWDWIISVSSYRDEFKELVNVSDFREAILALRFGQSGYAFVLDSHGNAVVHPRLKGNVFDVVDGNGHFFVRKICRLKNGKLRYSWRNPGEKEYREKLVIFNYLPEYDWIVASSSYAAEIYAPLQRVKWIILVAVLATLVLILPLTLLISASIIRPMRELIRRLTAATAGDLSVRMLQAPNDEIGQLSRHFNIFMEKLETYHNNLQLEISERRRLERELLNVSEREKQKFGRILHDDLGPHLIGTEVLSKVLKEKLERQSELSEATVAAEKIRELIAEAVSKTRNLARGLMPVEAAVYGLEASLEDLAENVSRIYNISCVLGSAEAVTLGDNTAATHIYYIVHEAVHNAVKHGEAKNIAISLKHEASVLMVKIVDDGSGLPDNPNPKGMGLSILRYRADCLGAELKIENQPGAGVMVELRLPATSLFGQGD